MMRMSRSHTLAFTFTLSAFALAGAPGCAAQDGDFTAGDPAAAEPIDSSEHAVAHGGPQLLWQNLASGEISAWLLDGKRVTGTQPLSWQCGAAGACSSQWQPIDTGYASILWQNPSTGQVQGWRFDSNGIVNTTPELSWRCDAASGCSTAWRPIGKVRIDGDQCDGLICGHEGLIWHNATSGEVGVWDLAFDGTTVLASRILPWKCGVAGNCSLLWRAVLTADFNGDGETDILWHNASTGEVSAWLLKGASVIGTQPLSWPCSQASGCAQSWRIVDAADVNHDGHVDLTWHNATTGEVSSWLLNGLGTVLGAYAFDWKCDAACSANWKAIGYTTFPFSI